MVLVPYRLAIFLGYIAVIRHILHAGRKRTPLPCTEMLLTTVDFITAVCYQVDNHLHGLPKHPHAALWPSEVVTLGLLHALTGVGNRAFSRWLTRDYRALCPRIPERTRLFHLFRTHHAWAESFSAAQASRTIAGLSAAHCVLW